MNSNSLLSNEGLPHFSKFSNDQIEPGISALLNKLEQDFNNLEEKIKNEKNIDNLYNLTIEETERIEYPLSFAWGLVSHLHSVKNNEELRDAYNKMQPCVIKLSNKISQSKILYDALDKLGGTSHLDKIKRRIVEASVQSMFLSGIGLEDKQKEEFNKIKLKLAELSTTFSNNVIDSIKEFEMFINDDKDMGQLPKSALELYSQQAREKHPESTPENGPWKVTLDIPSYLPIIQHHPSSELREKLYKEYITRASEGKHNNIPIIEEILKLKNKIANILDFKNYAELSLSKKMASSVQQIENLLIMIGDKAKPYAEEDMKKITCFASEKSDSCLDKLELWDVPYWCERYKEQELEFKEEDLKPYFPLDSVLSGLFKIASNLFGITVSEVDTVKENIDTWDESVKYFRITNDINGELIATFFLDPYSRPGEKRDGAWMDSCVDKNKYLNNKPTAYLVCNGTPPIKNGDGTKKPSLMTFREVETIFHEFGHGLQHMLTKVDNGGASGINNIEWDAVELPSQFMENWCYHKPTVKGFAKHYQTNDPLPDELFEKILKQRTFMTGGGMCRQVYLAMLDLYLYSHLKEYESILDVQKRIASQFLVRPILDEDKFLCSFSHIFAGGYSAGYYSYKWAEIMSADAFSAFEEIGLNDPQQVAEVGRRFRDTVLAKGGGEHPSEVFREFRGRDPTPDALLRHSGIV
jgi:oligopeptidase A